MNSYPRYVRPGRGPAHSPGVLAREAGLALAGKVNRWLAAGAVVLAGGVSVVTAHAFHARAAAAAPQSATSGASSSSAAAQPSSTDDGGSAQSSGPQAPAQAPASSAPATPAPAPVVSGGS